MKEAFVVVLVAATLVSRIIAMEPNLLDNNIESHGVLMERAGQLSGLISLIGPIDRNLHNWWIEYNTKWTQYNERLHSHSDIDEFYCPRHETLLIELGTLKNKTDLVKYGIDDKLEQLQKIKDVLEDPNVVGTTGFHCGKVAETNSTVNLTQANIPEATLVVIQTLCDSITNLTKVAEDERVKIKKEQQQVGVEIQYIEGYVCDCTYYGSDHSGTILEDCTKKCGNGTQKETRVKKWDLKNNGKNCTGGISQLPCNTHCCPRKCDWDEWGNWQACSDSCGASTQNCRERNATYGVDTCPSEENLDKCTGSSTETIITCAALKQQEERHIALETEVAALKAKVENFTAILCAEGCLNGGECVGNRVCQCQLGFSGSTCEESYEVTCSPGEKAVGGRCNSINCAANIITQSPGTKWNQPWCNQGRCLTSQDSGPGLELCPNKTGGYKSLDHNTTNWCQGATRLTLCPFPTAATTTATTTSTTPSPNPPASPPGLNPDITEGGCYEDRVPPNSKRERMLTGSYKNLLNNSPVACKEFCKDFKYFGVQNEYDCFCGNIIHHLVSATESECSQTCPGDEEQKCGGVYRQNLYSTNPPKVLWELAANIDPCDGNNFGYDGPWSRNEDVGNISQALSQDYINNTTWNKPLSYISIARHVNGQCTMSKTWKLKDSTRSLYQYFSTYPGRLLVTGDGSASDNHIYSDIPVSAEGLSGTWKDPIFGANGGLAFNWYYSNNGARIAVPGGYKVPYMLPGADDNTDDLHGLGNDFGGYTYRGEGTTKYGHDVAKIGPDCDTRSCQMVGTDHGIGLRDGECWGSYAIYISQTSTSFPCQGKQLTTA